MCVCLRERKKRRDKEREREREEEGGRESVRETKREKAKVRERKCVCASVNELFEGNHFSFDTSATLWSQFETKN